MSRHRKKKGTGVLSYGKEADASGALLVITTCEMMVIWSGMPTAELVRYKQKTDIL